MPDGVVVLHGAVLLMTAIAAFSDMRRGVIPNWLTLPAMMIAVLAHTLTAGALGAAYSLAGLVLCGVFPLVLFFRGAMGGGDVKLFAAIGAALGPSLALEAQLASLAVAGLFALFMMAWRGALFRTLRNLLHAALRPVLPPERRPELSEELTRAVRLGLAIFIGTALAIASSHAGGVV